MGNSARRPSAVPLRKDRSRYALVPTVPSVVRVGPVTGEEPHLLYGHRLWVSSVAVSSDGRWIASGSQDGTIRLWPMPKGKPFQTLPYGEFLERLRSFTNLRVVSDDDKRHGIPARARPVPGVGDVAGVVIGYALAPGCVYSQLSTLIGLVQSRRRRDRSQVAKHVLR